VTWQTIPGFPGWVASADGRVMDAVSGRLAPRASRSDSGYERVSVDGRTPRLHRLVLFAFRGPPPSSRHHGAHLDGDKGNNHLSNLDWKTPEENEADKKRHGTAPRGRTRKNLSPQKIGKVRASFVKGESVSRIARRYGLHRKTVSRCVRVLR
jgi:hypothetical protein